MSRFFNNYLIVYELSSHYNSSLCCKEAGQHDEISFDIFDICSYAFGICHFLSVLKIHLNDGGCRETSTQSPQVSCQCHGKNSEMTQNKVLVRSFITKQSPP
jgi:hypothetical protein